MARLVEYPWQAGPLQASPDGRHLVCGGKPFFWLGDTAWLLTEKLSVSQAEDYLENRAAKGFNVIQATLVHRFFDQVHYRSSGDAWDRPEPLRALENRDFQAPDLKSGYWRKVRQITRIAQEKGLFMGYLPAWGSMVKNGALNADNCLAYADFLAEQLGGFPNVIWIIGGDVRGSDGYEVFMKLGQALKDRCPEHLTAYHPFGRTASSLWFDDAPWLDLNMFQSGHRDYAQSAAGMGAWDDNLAAEGDFGEDNWRYVRRDYAAAHKRPTLDAEPSYEKIPHGLHDPSQPLWQDCDVRRYAYWSVFEGACGHTYGHNAIMQFYTSWEEKGAYGCLASWRRAMHDPGAGQMQFLKKLMLSVDFCSGAPAPQLLAQQQKSRYERVSVIAGAGFAFFYTYSGQKFDAALGAISADTVRASWYDPASGVESPIGTLRAQGVETFEPPEKSDGAHRDWVLKLLWA